jgi:hypothetical protein
MTGGFLLLGIITYSVIIRRIEPLSLGEIEPAAVSAR